MSKPETLIIGTTDTGSHGLELATDIKTCIQAKKIKMLIILQGLSFDPKHPNFDPKRGTIGASTDMESLNAYKALVGDKNVVDIDKVGEAGLQERVKKTVKSGCTQPGKNQTTNSSSTLGRKLS